MSSSQNGRFPATIEEAIQIVHPLGLVHAADYYNFINGKHRRLGKPKVTLPPLPQFYWDDFHEKGGWRFFLGPSYKGSKIYVPRPFKSARTFVRKLHLTGQHQWEAYCRGDLEESHGKRPKDIPTNPEKMKTYKGLYKNLGDWLGTGNVSSRDKKLWSFKKTKRFAHTLPFTYGREWRAWMQGKLCPEIERPKGIPKWPSDIFKHKGWKGWSDFYGRTPTHIPFARTSPIMPLSAFVATLVRFELTNGLVYDLFKKQKASWLSKQKIYLPMRKKIPDYYPSWEGW